MVDFDLIKGKIKPCTNRIVRLIKDIEMDKILEQVAFNLSSLHDFSPEFVAANEKFALAVIKEYQAAIQSKAATPDGVYDVNDTEQFWDSPEDFCVEGDVQVGEEFELLVGYSTKATFKVISKEAGIGYRCIQISGDKLYPSAVPQEGNAEAEQLADLFDACHHAVCDILDIPKNERDDALPEIVTNWIEERAEQGEAAFIGTLQVDFTLDKAKPDWWPKEATKIYTAPLQVTPVTPQKQTQDYILTMPAMLHKSTKALIANFATALAQKAYEAEGKYGYSDHWAQPDWMDKCRFDLQHHVKKGDPRDVAIYSAFLWHHGESTAVV